VQRSFCCNWILTQCNVCVCVCVSNFSCKYRVCPLAYGEEKTVRGGKWQYTDQKQAGTPRMAGIHQTICHSSLTHLYERLRMGHHRCRRRRLWTQAKCLCVRISCNLLLLHTRITSYVLYSESASSSTVSSPVIIHKIIIFPVFI